MDKETYTTKLGWFKENERPEALLRVAQDPDLMKIVIAWGSTSPRVRPKLTQLRSECEGDVWEWLWRNTEYSSFSLATRAGVSRYLFEEKLAVLIGNRVLYPDGTVNSFVERYLREEVLKLFEGVKAKSSKAAVG